MRYYGSADNADHYSARQVGECSRSLPFAACGESYRERRADGIARASHIEHRAPRRLVTRNIA